MKETTEQEMIEAALCFMGQAIYNLSVAAQNASQVKGNLYNKIDGIRNRLFTLLTIEKNKRGM